MPSPSAYNTHKAHRVWAQYSGTTCIGITANRNSPFSQRPSAFVCEPLSRCVHLPGFWEHGLYNIERYLSILYYLCWESLLCSSLVSGIIYTHVCNTCSCPVCMLVCVVVLHVCQSYNGVHCTDESPRKVKQPLSNDVSLQFSTCTWHTHTQW